MKTTKIMKNLNILLKVMLLAVLFPSLVMAQEPAEKELRIKMVKDVNGKLTTVDTVINISSFLDQEKLNELLSALGEEDLGFSLHDLKNMSIPDDVLFLKSDSLLENMVVLTKEIEITGDGESTMELVISSGEEGDGYRYFISGAGDTTVFNKAGESIYVVQTEGTAGKKIITIGDDHPDTPPLSSFVEVEETPDGKTIKVTRENGEVQEFKVNEQGTYLIDKEGNITKTENPEPMQWNALQGNDLVWVTLSEEDQNSTVVVKQVSTDENDCGTGTGKKHLIITSEEVFDENGENVIIKKHDGQKSERIIILSHQSLLHDLTELETKSLVKSGVIKNEQEATLVIDDLTFNPNPNNGRFRLGFTAPEKGTVSVNIYDMNGKNIFTDTLNNFDGRYENDIDISNHKEGIYFLRIEQHNKAITQKIVLQ